MRNSGFIVLSFLLLFSGACQSDSSGESSVGAAAPKSLVVPFEDPIDLYGTLYSEVQLSGIFEDDLFFAQAKPLMAPAEINKAYALAKKETGFDLLDFVKKHFELKEDALEQKKYPDVSGFFDKDLVLTPEMAAADYLLEMPQPHFLTGSNNSEISYQDAYWIMLGLEKMGRIDEIRAMMDNFSSWINAYGYIPEGNRAYQLTRSNPPMFALMIELLAKYDGQAAYRKYFKVLETEYQFWMKGEIQVYNLKEPVRRVVLLPEKNAVLNRYWDEKDMPRSEYYAADIALAKAGNVINSLVYRNLRAASESGWDLSSRWVGGGDDWYRVSAADMFAVDLNALLYQTEATLLTMYRQLKNEAKAYDMEARMERRKDAMFEYCWNEEKGYFFDYNFVTGQQSSEVTLAGMYPLFTGLATPQRAFATAELLEKELLKAGGLGTTTLNTGKVYDGTNGLPGLHWVAIAGLEKFGKRELAEEIRQKWVNTVRKSYQSAGKLYGYYDVANQSPGKVPPGDGFARMKLHAFAATAALLVVMEGK